MKKKTALLSLGLVLSLAGIATASALIIENANASTQGALDAGLILEWGQADLDNVTNLRFGSPQIKELVIKTPVKSASVKGDAVLGFELSGTNVSTIQVEIFSENAWGAAAEEAVEGAEAENAAVPDHVLNATTTTCKYEIDLATFTEDMTFTLRYSLTAVPEDTPSATLKASYYYQAPVETNENDDSQNSGQQTGANEGDEAAGEGI